MSSYCIERSESAKYSGTSSFLTTVTIVVVSDTVFGLFLALTVDTGTGGALALWELLSCLTCIGESNFSKSLLLDLFLWSLSCWDFVPAIGRLPYGPFFLGFESHELSYFERLSGYGVSSPSFSKLSNLMLILYVGDQWSYIRNYYYKTLYDPKTG